MKIHREQIIDAGMLLLDRDGLEGVTLRRVAAELHVQAGALYWHVRNKQDLLDEMANALLAQQFAQVDEPAPEQDWADWLRGICQRLRQAMLAHREGARVVAGASFGRAVLLKQLAETIIRKLVDAGFSLHLAYLTCITVLSYIYGFVIEEQAGPSDEMVRKHATDDSILAAILRESQANNYMTDADFLAGLEMILAGAQQKVMQQAH